MQTETRCTLVFSEEGRCNFRAEGKIQIALNVGQKTGSELNVSSFFRYAF